MAEHPADNSSEFKKPDGLPDEDWPFKMKDENDKRFYDIQRDYPSVPEDEVDLGIETVEDLEHLRELGEKIKQTRAEALEHTKETLRNMSWEERGKLINKWVSETHPERNKLRYDPRFPNQNITKRCWVNYIDMHRCLRDFHSTYQCMKYIRTVKAICPTDWTDAWDEQLKNNLFPGVIVKPRSMEQVAKKLHVDPKILKEFAEKHGVEK